MPWDFLIHFNGWILVLGLSLWFFLLWVLQLQRKNASLADVGFCVGLWILVLVCALNGQGDSDRRFLVGLLASLYAFRLGGHLFFDRVWQKNEDPRYQYLRKWLGKGEEIGAFLYFQLQGPACLFFAGLFCWVMSHPETGLGLWDLFSVLLICVALVGEAFADRQLARFRANPLNKGKILETGLWRYSRHPNYFFESLHWWAYLPMAVGLPWFGLVIIWPIVMTGSLLWITGIPWAEAQALKNRGESYRRYQHRTNRCFPWFPRKVS